MEQGQGIGSGLQAADPPRYTNSQKESPMGPFTHTDGHNLPWLIDELVPGEARMIDYVVI